MSITLDVDTQNCILRNVTAHLRLHQMGTRMSRADPHWRRQQAQLAITKMGRRGALWGVAWKCNCRKAENN